MRSRMSMEDLLAAMRERTLGQNIERVCRLLLGLRIRFVEMRAGSPCEACGGMNVPFAMIVTAEHVHHLCTDCAEASDDLKVTVVEMLRRAAGGHMAGDHRRPRAAVLKLVHPVNPAVVDSTADDHDHDRNDGEQP